jgi:ApaG protein
VKNVDLGISARGQRFFCADTGKGLHPMVDSQATTRGIQVTVRSSYVPDRSQPTQGQWFFSYRIRISNGGSVPVQLLNRHWVITDAHGRVEEVRGPGVVGEQPVMAPGESFEYTSFCPLGTPFGTMEGSYEMVTEDGKRFWAKIGQFTLSQPMAVN